MTPETQMDIASVTKTVTAAAVLRLAEQGLVDLGTPIADSLPRSLAVDTNGATVRDVLRMRSGLVDPTGDELIVRAIRSPDVAIDRATVLAAMPPAAGAPDVETRYADVNYVLLSYVIEQASGKTIGHALRSLVLDDPTLQRLVFQDEERPQGPVATSRIDPEVETTPGLQAVVGSAATTSGFVPSRSLATEQSTAGAIASDAPTLAQWGYRLYGGSVVSEASLDAMTDFASGSTPYGMGTHALSWPFGQQGIGHDGYAFGYVATLETRPVTGVTVAVLTNDARSPTFWPVADQLAEIATACAP